MMLTNSIDNSFQLWRDNTCLPLAKSQLLLLLSFGMSMAVITQSILIINVDTIADENASLINITETQAQALVNFYLPFMDASAAIGGSFIFVLILLLPQYADIKKNVNNRKHVSAILLAGLIATAVGLAIIEVLLSLLPKLIKLINDDIKLLDLIQDINAKQMLYMIAFVIKAFLEQWLFATNKEWLTALSTMISIVLATIAVFTIPFNDFSSQITLPFIGSESLLVMIYAFIISIKYKEIIKNIKNVTWLLLIEKLKEIAQQVLPLLFANTLNVISPLVHAMLALSMSLTAAANTQQFYMFYYVNYLLLMASILLTEIMVKQNQGNINVQKQCIHAIFFNSTIGSLVTMIGFLLYQYQKNKSVNVFVMFGVIYGFCEIMKSILLAANRAQSAKQNKKVSTITTIGLAASMGSMLAMKFTMQDADSTTQALALLAAPMILSVLSMIVLGVMFCNIVKKAEDASDNHRSDMFAVGSDLEDPDKRLVPFLPVIPGYS